MSEASLYTSGVLAWRIAHFLGSDEAEELYLAKSLNNVAKPSLSTEEYFQYTQKLETVFPSCKGFISGPCTQKRSSELVLLEAVREQMKADNFAINQDFTDKVMCDIFVVCYKSIFMGLLLSFTFFLIFSGNVKNCVAFFTNRMLLLFKMEYIFLSVFRLR